MLPSVHQSKDEEMLRECDEYIARLRLSIDMRIAKMREINEVISGDQIWTMISHSLETFSLLDVRDTLILSYLKFHSKPLLNLNTAALTCSILREVELLEKLISFFIN